MTGIERSNAPVKQHPWSRSPQEGAAAGLFALMSGISEGCWSAGWLRGLDRACWEAVEQGGLAAYGQGAITPRQASLLRLLSEEADGWWRWDEADADPVFVSLAEWRAGLSNLGG